MRLVRRLGTDVLAFTRLGTFPTIVLRSTLVLLTFAIGWSLFAHRPKAERLPKAVKNLLQQIDATSPKALPIVLNTGRYPAFQQQFEGREAFALRAENAQRTEKVLRLVQRYGTTSFWWMDVGLPVAPAVRAALLQHHQVGTVLRADDFDAVLLVPAEGALKATLLHSGSKEGGEWLDKASPWTAAYRVPASELLAHAPGSLVVQVAYLPQGGRSPSSSSAVGGIALSISSGSPFRAAAPMIVSSLAAWCATCGNCVMPMRKWGVTSGTTAPTACWCGSSKWN